MQKKVALCGLYCGACSSMILREKLDGTPKLEHLHTYENEEPCSGCGSENLQSCEFVQCNLAHGTQSCAFCPEFPCPMILTFKDDEWVHHKTVIDSLERIKEIGLEAWETEQQEYWKCKSCGARTQWYQRACGVCNTPIENPPF